MVFKLPKVFADISERFAEASRRREEEEERRRREFEEEERRKMEASEEKAKKFEEGVRGFFGKAKETISTPKLFKERVFKPYEFFLRAGMEALPVPEPEKVAKPFRELFKRPAPEVKPRREAVTPAETGLEAAGAITSQIGQFLLAGKVANAVLNIAGKGLAYRNAPKHIRDLVKAGEVAGAWKFTAQAAPWLRGAIQWGIYAVPRLKAPTLIGKTRELATEMAIGGAFGKIAGVKEFGPVQRYLADIAAPFIIRSTLGGDPEEAKEEVKWYAALGLPFLVAGLKTVKGERLPVPVGKAMPPAPAMPPAKVVRLPEVSLIKKFPQIEEMAKKGVPAVEIQNRLMATKAIVDFKEAPLAKIDEAIKVIKKPVIEKVPPARPPVAKPPVKAISKELEPLAKEARRYGSAEEFVERLEDIKQKALVGGRGGYEAAQTHKAFVGLLEKTKRQFGSLQNFYAQTTKVAPPVKPPVAPPTEIAAEQERALAEARAGIKEERKEVMAVRTGEDLQAILNRMTLTKEGMWALPDSVKGVKMDWGEIAEDMGYTPTGVTVEPKPGQVVDKLFYSHLVELKGGRPAVGVKLPKVPKVKMARVKKTLYDKLPPEFFRVVKDWEGKAQAVVARPIEKVKEKIARREIEPKIKEERAFLRSMTKKPPTVKQVNEFAKIMKKATDDALKGKIAHRTTKAGNVVPIIRGGQTIPAKLVENAHELKDIRAPSKIIIDWERNFEKVFRGRTNTPEYKEFVRGFSGALNAASDEIEMKREGIMGDIIEPLDAHRYSKEEMAIQEYGEKEITFDELKKRFPKKAEGLANADSWFRKEYNDYLDRINPLRIKMGKPPIEKMENYYRHMWQLSGLEGFAEVFKRSYEVDPLVVGVSEYTQPISRWLSFAQRRTGKEGYVKGAVRGYLNYITPAAYAIHVDPWVGKFRALADALAEQTKDTRHLNNFIWWLNQHANGLAGKSMGLDRSLENYIFIDRRLASLARNLNIRIKNNIILGNLNPQLTQVLNLHQTFAVVDIDCSLGAAWETVTHGFGKKGDFVLENSGFVRRRSRLYKQFDPTLLERPKRLAGWLGSTLEEGATRISWNAYFRQAIKDGLSKEEAIIRAERETKRTMAGRGFGELPLGYQSRYLGSALLAFQLEMGNALLYYPDIATGQIPNSANWRQALAMLAKLMVFAWLFNNVYERQRGSRPLFDPIDAITDAMFEEDRTAFERGGRLLAEFLDNAPGGYLLAMIYPVEGGEIQFPGERKITLPPREEFLGPEFRGRFGVPPLISGYLKPELVFPPYGGAQAKKIADAWKAIKRGYVETETGKEAFPIEGIFDQIQAFLFGPSSIPAAQEYFEEQEKISRLERRADRERMDEWKIALNISRDIARAKTPEERRTIILNYKERGLLSTDIIEKLKQYYEEKGKEIGVTEARQKALSVEERAKLILREVSKFRESDPSKVAPYLVNLKKTGILTSAVIAEMKRVVQEGEEYKRESPFKGFFKEAKEKFTGFFTP